MLLTHTYIGFLAVPQKCEFYMGAARMPALALRPCGVVP